MRNNQRRTAQMKLRTSLAVSAISLLSLIGFGIFGMVYLSEENSWSTAQVEEVYNKMQKVAGFDTPPLKIVDDPILNAWTDGESITLTTGILSTLKSEDEIAEVLGHEMAHNILGHVSENKSISEKDYFDFADDTTLDEALLSQKHEAAADLYGTALMMRAGYDVCQAPNWFKLLRTQSGDTLGSDHPGYGFRIWYMTYPQCK